MPNQMQSAIAYWLLPGAAARDFFCREIRRLAAKCDAPLFEPHLTLAVGPDVSGEPDDTLARLVEATRSLRIAVRHGTDELVAAMSRADALPDLLVQPVLREFTTFVAITPHVASSVS